MARKILLADDSVTAQNMGRKILADAGYEVITVNNGSAALKKITEHKPDLIVLDVYMPGYSGLEVCQRLKESHETAQVPVLLTVGKLEPFKPDEAKRVRADAFIVKPFEASELLSALSKLEDKIVPRGETAKPGRFARANAAIEEGRYDKSVAVDEDSGWRNRIAFPSKKKEKEKPAQENGDETVIYNAMNKDLRTVVENKLAEERHDANDENARVDLGALAPEGLPKDVTPEEIAALAAAAAQVKGKFAEIHPAESLKKAEAEHTVEAKDPVQAQPLVEAPQVETPVEPEKSEIKIEAAEAIDPQMESPTVSAPSPSDVMAALAGLESASNSSDESRLEAEQAADEPITMAAAAGAGNGSAISRWTAVSVALAPEEAAVSLEQEMQKAYAAFAASETGHAGYAMASAETQPAAEPEASLSVPASAAPEAAQTLSAVASAATEAVSAAVKELEAVAASYVSEPAKPEEVAPLAEEPPQVEASKSDTPELAHEQHKEDHQQETKYDEATAGATEPVVAIESQAAAPPIVETSTPAVHSDLPEQGSEVSPAKIEASVAEQTAAPSTGSGPQAESDGTESTAAAWANWRRVRESGHNGGDAVAPNPQDAAMAVAAGAEKSPEESSATETDAESIASIVDSVLADLRPKIFEEISRKMGKKK